MLRIRIRSDPALFVGLGFNRKFLYDEPDPQYWWLILNTYIWLGEHHQLCQLCDVYWAGAVPKPRPSPSHQVRATATKTKGDEHYLSTQGGGLIVDISSEV